MHFWQYIYAALAVVVVFTLLAALGEARVAKDSTERRRWYLVALAAVFAQPAFVYFGVTYLGRALVRVASQNGGELSWSGAVGPWMIAVQFALMIGSTMLLMSAVSRFKTRWDRGFTRVHVATAFLGLVPFLLALLASTSGLPESATAGVSNAHGLRFIYSCGGGVSVQSVEWPARLPIIAETVRAEVDWLDECPSQPRVEFSERGHVSVRDEDGLLWMTYEPANTGFLPGAGGTFKDVRWNRPRSSVSSAGPVQGHR